MLAIYRYLFGYVRLLLSGENPERFINYCLLHGISIWNIKRRNSGLYLCLSVSDYKKIIHIKKDLKANIKFKLKGKFGLPFLWAKLIKRPAILLGIALILVMNFTLSNFIWNIDVNGLDGANKQEIIAVCNELGVRAGTLKSSIDQHNLPQQIALKTPNVAWISVNIEGTKVTINLTNDSGYVPEEKPEPSNLVAACDGVVKSAEIIGGKRQFNLGQAVRKGDILVSGILENETLTKYVKSSGTIIAETHRTFSVKVSKKHTVYKQNFKPVRKRVIMFFWAEMPMYLSGIKDYESSYLQTKNLKLFGQELPIGVTERVFFTAVKNELTLSKEECENIAVLNVSNTIRNLKINSVISFSVESKEHENYFLVTVKTVCLEDIAAEQKIETDY